MSKYTRADYAPLRETIYGIGFHWTTWTLPVDGKPLPFPEAVERFDVPAFVEQAQETGAGHVMITATHEFHWLPCPNPEVDRIMSGRTCGRDLIMEIADGLAAVGIKFMLYYNHGTYKPSKDYTQDPQWQEAVGALKDDRSEYYDNYCRVLGWMGEHYGEKVIAYWLDSAYEHVKYADTPWERFTAAAKAGHPGRLVTYNSGVFNTQMYTEYQDFWAGEINGINYWPTTPVMPPWGTEGEPFPIYSLATWASYDPYFQQADWGIHDERGLKHPWRETDPEAAAHYIRVFNSYGGAVTFNMLCYQDGSIIDQDFRTMQGVRKIIRG